MQTYLYRYTFLAYKDLANLYFVVRLWYSRISVFSACLSSQSNPILVWSVVAIAVLRKQKKVAVKQLNTKKDDKCKKSRRWGRHNKGLGKVVRYPSALKNNATSPLCRCTVWQKETFTHITFVCACVYSSFAIKHSIYILVN